MKVKKHFIIILLLISNFTIAQELKTSVIISSGISLYSFKSSEAEMNNLIIKNRGSNFCFSAAIREEFYFPKLISLGLELNYLNTKGSFVSPTPPMNAIPENYSKYRHFLSVHSLDIPVFLRLRTNSKTIKEFSLYCGSGLTWITNAYRDVELVNGYMGYPPTNIVPVAKGTVTLINDNNNQIGFFGILGIGKNFEINNKIFFCEAKYRFDFNKWTYSLLNNPVNSSFYIKRQGLLLNFGIIF